MKRMILTLTIVSAVALASLGIARAQDDSDLPGDPDEEMAGPMPGGPGDPGPMTWFAHRGPMDGRGGGAGMMGMGGGMGRGMLGLEGALLRGGGRLAEELELTDAQRDKLHSIGDALARKRIQLRADLDLARLDLRSAMRSDSPSLTQLTGKIDAVARIQGQMMKAGVTARLDARKVLTPEQLKKLSELKSHPRVRFRDGGGGGRGPRWNSR